MLACPNSYKKDGKTWIGGCGFASAVPRCYCRQKLPKVDFYSAVGRLNRWQCNRSRCGFSCLIEQSIDRRTGGGVKHEDLDRNLSDDEFLDNDEDECDY